MSSNLNRKILLLLECPACLEYMKAPIFSCVKGHNVCSSCCRRLNICPSCRYAVTTSVRNYILESIAEILEYPCYNAAAGCTETFRLNHIEDHVTICSYRYYPCILGDPNAPCAFEGRRLEILQHAKAEHPNKVSAGVESTIFWCHEDPKNETLLVEAYEEIFYIRRKMIRSNSGSTMYWAVQYIGRSEDAKRFLYKFSLVNADYHLRKIENIELCMDDLKSMEEIIKSGICVSVPMQRLESFMYEGQLECQLTIISND